MTRSGGGGDDDDDNDDDDNDDDDDDDSGEYSSGLRYISSINLASEGDGNDDV